MVKMIDIDDFVLNRLHADAQECLDKLKNIEDETLRSQLESLCDAVMFISYAITTSAFVNPIPIMSAQFDNILSEEPTGEYDRGVHSGIRIAKGAIDSMNTFIEETVKMEENS